MVWIEQGDRLTDRHRHRPGHGRLGCGHLGFGQQLALAIEAAQLDRRAAEVDADQLAHGECCLAIHPG